MSSTTADRLRAAVTAGAYWEVDQLLCVYRREVEATWKTTRSKEKRREIATEVTTLLQWARNSILASRSHTQSRVIEFSRQGAYSPAMSKVDQLELDA